MKWYIIPLAILFVFSSWFFITSLIDNKEENKQEEIQTIKEQIAKIESDSGRTLTNEEKLWYLLDLEYKFSLEEKIDAMIIVKCESKFDLYAINVNRNGSLDLGIWQINERIHKLSRECMFDMYCSTEYAINQLYAKNKNFSAWVCAK
jgi:arginine utilization protein RocB